MKVGDYVGLKQAFVPSLVYPYPYHFGIVEGIISSKQGSGVLIQLYDPEQDICYTDEWGATAIYQFQASELEALGCSSDLINKGKEGWAA